MIIDKLPPHNKDMERSVLGLIMMEATAYEKVADVLHSRCFYDKHHETVYEAITRLANRNSSLDMMNVLAEVKNMGKLEEVGGPFFFTTLTNAIVSGAEIYSHARVIKDDFIKRELIRYSMELLNSSYDETRLAEDILNDAGEEFSKIGESLEGASDMSHISDTVARLFNKIHAWRINYELTGSSVTGVQSGCELLDHITRGWQPADLIYLAARPSTGKTAKALTWAKAAAKALAPLKKAVGVWSLEMEDIMLCARMLADESGEDLYRILTGRFTEAEVNALQKKIGKVLSELGIYFNDTSGLTPSRLKIAARKLKRKHALGMIIIDYLQLMKGNQKANREREVAGISSDLKELAKELKVPIVALSQLSREVEKRASSEPILADMRDSGSIEQDADVVMFLYRPTEAEIAANPNLKDVVILKIAKNRNGSLGKVYFKFNSDTQTFRNITKDEAYEGEGPVYPQQGNWKPVDLPVKNNNDFIDDDAPF